MDLYLNMRRGRRAPPTRLRRAHQTTWGRGHGDDQSEERAGERKEGVDQRMQTVRNGRPISGYAHTRFPFEEEHL